jgi:hypothetical protein
VIYEAFLTVFLEPGERFPELEPRELVPRLVEVVRDLELVEVVRDLGPLELLFADDLVDALRRFDPLELFEEDEFLADPPDLLCRWTRTVPPPAPASLWMAAVPRQRPTAFFAFLTPEATPLPPALPTRKVAYAPPATAAARSAQTPRSGPDFRPTGRPKTLFRPAMEPSFPSGCDVRPRPPGLSASH